MSITTNAAPLPSDEGKGQLEFIRQHVYRNEDGSIFCMKKLFRKPDGKKTATFERYDPNTGKYRKGLDGMTAPLYRLPELLESTGDLFIVEGEKDSDRLASWGLNSTSLPYGAGSSFRSTWLDYIMNRNIIVLTDNDQPGQQYGEMICRAVYDTVHTIRVIPAVAIDADVVPKGDISDIADVHGDELTLKKLLIIVRRTPPREKPADPMPEQPTTSTASSTVSASGNGDSKWFLNTYLQTFLDAIPPSCDRRTWVAVGIALKKEEYPFEIFDKWSAGCPDKYDQNECQKVWDHPGQSKVNGGTIVKLARQYGVNTSDFRREIRIEEKQSYDEMMEADDRRNRPLDLVAWANRFGVTLTRAEENVVTRDRTYYGICPFCRGADAHFIVHPSGKIGFFHITEKCDHRIWSDPKYGARQKAEMNYFNKKWREHQQAKERGEE